VFIEQPHDLVAPDLALGVLGAKDGKPRFLHVFLKVVVQHAQFELLVSRDRGRSTVHGISHFLHRTFEFFQQLRSQRSPIQPGQSRIHRSTP
jgi:hypothetical protein